MCMFTAALFTIAKTWNQPTCPSVIQWIQKIWYIYTMEYYASVKRNEIVQTGWLKPVIPPLWEADAGGLPELSSSKPAWETW